MDICPMCEKSVEAIFRRGPETLSIRGERITVDIEYYQCPECREQWIDLNSPYDHLTEAYKKYEALTGRDIKGNPVGKEV